MSLNIQSIPYPEYTSIERDALTTAPKGFKIFNTDTSNFEMYDGLIWESFGGVSSNRIESTSGNSYAEFGTIGTPGIEEYLTVKTISTTNSDSIVNFKDGVDANVFTIDVAGNSWKGIKKAIFSTGTAVSNSTNWFLAGAGGTAYDYTNIVGNIGIGENNLSNLTATGSNNIAIGNGAGYSLLSGDYNVILGLNSGAGLNTGYQNTLVGRDSGRVLNIGYNNTFIGHQAGYTGTASGTYESVSIGAPAIGYRSVAIGFSAGSTGAGNDCVKVGHFAGGVADGTYNTLIGKSSGHYADGGYNVMLGGYTGWSNTTGAYNIFLGHKAGFYETGSNVLMISSLEHADQVNEATARTKAMIYGVMDVNTENQTLRINASLQIFSPNTYLSSSGSPEQLTFTDSVSGTVSLSNLARLDIANNFAAKNTMAASTTSSTGFNLPDGAIPASGTTIGDLFVTSSELYFVDVLGPQKIWTEGNLTDVAFTNVDNNFTVSQTVNTGDVGTTFLRTVGGGDFEIHIDNVTAAWSRGLTVLNDATPYGGFYAYGTGSTNLSYLSIGKAYNDFGIRIYLDAATELTYDNSIKLATTTTGVLISDILSISDLTTTLSKDGSDNLVLTDTVAGSRTLVSLVNDYVTIGTGGEYATIQLAYDAGYRKLKVVSDVVEGALNTGTSHVYVFGDDVSLITLGVSGAGTIKFVQCNVLITTDVGLNANFDNCKIEFDGGYLSGPYATITNNSIVTYTSGLGIYSGNISDSRIYHSGGSNLYMSEATNCAIIGDGTILSGWLVNCNSTATLLLSQCSIANSYLPNSNIVMSILNLKATNSVVNNITYNVENCIIQGNTINGDVAYGANAHYNKLVNNVVTGTVTFNAGASNNLISGNTLSTGFSVGGDNNSFTNCSIKTGTITVDATADKALVTGCRTATSIVDNGTNSIIRDNQLI